MVSEVSSTRQEEPRIKVEHEGNQPKTPITYVPRHLRQEMAAAAQAQTPTRAPATPPQRASTSGSGSGTIEASPANRGPPPAEAPEANGLVTPIQTPTRAQRPPPPPRGPAPRAVATSPLARMTSAPERSVSFVEPTSMPARAASADGADQMTHDVDPANHQGNDNDDDDDAFPLSTQDDAFFATVDLGEGDFGRPIDFDEGMGGVSMMDASKLEPELDSAERSPAVLPQPQPQVRDRTGSGSSAGSSSSGPGKVNMRNEAPPARPSPSITGHAEPNASASGRQPQNRSGIPNTGSTSSTRAARPPMTSVGGFNYPSGMVRLFREVGDTWLNVYMHAFPLSTYRFGAQKPQMQHISKPVVPACVRTTPGTSQTAGATNVNVNALKRNADVMQCVYIGLSRWRYSITWCDHFRAGSSTRPPMQGMGLAQRQQQQQQQQQQSPAARRPSDTNIGEGHDPKRFKR